jgi:uncharacterized protein (TIGR00369 family)
MSVVEYKRGFVILSMPLSEEFRGGYEGTSHGGILATFADAACASCLVGCYDLDSEFTVTTDMRVRYYRQPRGGSLRIEAEITRFTRRTAARPASSLGGNQLHRSLTGNIWCARCVLPANWLLALLVPVRAVLV